VIRLGVVRLVLILATALGVAGASPTPPEQSALAQAFWAGIDYLGLTFKAVGSLGAGADRGRVWIVDLATGERRQVSSADDLAWPVLGLDRSTIFALHGRQVVRLASRGGGIVPVGPEADWRKLVGVDATGDVLGFVAGRPRAQPALMTEKGQLMLLPQPEKEQEKARVSMLLQENFAYADGRRLVVTRSQRGGRGYDVSLVTDDSTKNLSDCGDDHRIGKARPVPVEVRSAFAFAGRTIRSLHPRFVTLTASVEPSLPVYTGPSDMRWTISACPPGCYTLMPDLGAIFVSGSKRILIGADR
jgi:hypothetical protein